MNFYEKEMRQMFGDSDIIHDAKFVGRTMLGKLDDDLRVKLEFIATHISGKFNAIKASVINRAEGVVDQQVFKFADIIGAYNRPGMSPIDPHMWEYAAKPEWYTPVTLSQKAQIADRVLDYIFMYQGEDMSMSAPTM